MSSRVSRETIAADAAGLGVTLARGAPALLGSLLDLILDRAVSLGLVAEADRDRAYQRHLLDCLRAARLVRSGDGLAYDVGSGAGLPGLVLAIATPWCTWRLIEPRRRAAGFLELAADRLGLANVEVILARAEEVLGEPGDLVTARAFGPLNRSWAAARPLLRAGGRMLYFAGRRLRTPEATARALRPAPASVTVENGCSLVIMGR